MNQTTLVISWKDPANRGAVLSVFGLSLLIQALASVHAILVYQLGNSLEELILISVVSITVSIILAVVILTGLEYLNENSPADELKYTGISGVSVIVLLIFMGTYALGYELVKSYLTNLKSTPADIEFLITEGIGTLSVYAFFYLFHLWNKFRASVKL